MNALEGEEDSNICYPLDGKDKCILCSAGFSFFRRQHHCRLCNVLCCDDCSKKRVIMQSKVITAFTTQDITDINLMKLFCKHLQYRKKECAIRVTTWHPIAFNIISNSD
jgi:hypothetical protein